MSQTSWCTEVSYSDIIGDRCVEMESALLEKWQKIKVKWMMLPWECRQGAHLPFVGFDKTYGHLPSLRASPSFDQFQVILLGDRGTVAHRCLSSLPKATVLYPGKTWTSDLWITSLMPCQRHRHTTWNDGNIAQLENAGQVQLGLFAYKVLTC